MVGLALRLVLSLAIVLGLFWMVARTGSRKLGGRDRALMRVRSRQSLSRSSSLAVVEVGRRVLVVGVSDGGVRLLTEMDPADLEVTPEPAPVRVRRTRPAAPALATAPARVVPVPAGVPRDVEAALEALDARIDAYAPAGADDAAYAEAEADDAGDRADEAVDGKDQPSYASYQEHYEQVYDVAPVRPRAEGALAGSLLSVSTWRAAWDTAVGRGHRPMDGDAA